MKGLVGTFQQKKAPVIYFNSFGGGSFLRSKVSIIGWLLLIRITFQGADIICPEGRLLGEGDVLCVNIE